MKNGLSIFFLSLYAITVFSSLLPYMEYAINYDYITKVLCVKKDIPGNTCKGKCHLEKKIAESVKAQIPVENNESVPAVLSARDFSPAILQNNLLHILSPIFEIGKYKTNQVFYEKELFKRIFHPPQLV